MTNITIGYAMTGSFCTIPKSIETLKEIIKAGYTVIPILSNNAATMNTRYTNANNLIEELHLITGNLPITTIVEAEPIGPKRLLDLLCIAPTTGNTIAKLALGITDTTVTMAAKAHLRNGRPLVIGISTNDGLGGSAKNIGLLMNNKNIFMIPYGQDDHLKKHNSLVYKCERTLEAIESALKGIQLQPVLM